MTAAAPQSLADRLGEALVAELESAGHLGSLGEFKRRRFERDIAEVAKTDAAVAYRCSAVLATLDGNIEQVERDLAAARLLNDPMVDLQLMYSLSNLGYATRSLQLARQKMRPGIPELAHLVRAATAIGAVTTASAAIEAAVVGQHVLSPVANQAIQVARRAAMALNLAGRTEDELVAVIDVAGEILRSHRLLWLDRCPHVISLLGDEGDESSAGVHYLMRLDVSPAEAAAMTGDLASMLVERDLDRSGISIAFVGSKSDGVLAA